MIHTNFLDDGDNEGDDDQDHDVDDNEEYVEADDTIEEQVEKLEVSLEGACSAADEELGMFDDQDGNGDDNGDDKSNKGLEISNASSFNQRLNFLTAGLLTRGQNSVVQSAVSGPVS